MLIVVTIQKQAPSQNDPLPPIFCVRFYTTEIMRYLTGHFDIKTWWAYLANHQTALFALFGIDDILEIVGNPKGDARRAVGILKDFVFSTIGFPVGVFVSVSFWGLYAIDRDLVFPDELDQFFPPITNDMVRDLRHHSFPSSGDHLKLTKKLWNRKKLVQRFEQ